MSKRPEFRRGLLLSSHSSVPCWTAETLFLRSARRISFGNRNSYGHSHQQIWFCGRCHRLGHHPSAPGAAVILHPSSSLAPYTSQTADVIFCRREEIISCCLFFPTNTSQSLNHNNFYKSERNTVVKQIYLIYGVPEVLHSRILLFHYNLTLGGSSILITLSSQSSYYKEMRLCFRVGPDVCYKYNSWKHRISDPRAQVLNNKLAKRREKNLINSFKYTFI